MLLTMNITNDFGTLSAESAESHYAQFTPEEHQECQQFLDQAAANFEACRHAECDQEDEEKFIPCRFAGPDLFLTDFMGRA